MAKILLIGDESGSRSAFVRVCIARGHRAFTAESAAGGLVIAHAERPDLVALDLPAIAQIARVLRELRAAERRSVFVLLGAAETGAKPQLLSDGAADCFVRPFVPSTLLARMERWL